MVFFIRVFVKDGDLNIAMMGGKSSYFMFYCIGSCNKFLLHLYMDDYPWRIL